MVIQETQFLNIIISNVIRVVTCKREKRIGIYIIIHLICYLKSYDALVEVDAVISALTECMEHRLLKSLSHNSHEASRAHGTCTSSLQPRCRQDSMAPYWWHITQRCPEAVQTAASSPTMRVPIICTPDDQTAQSPCIQTSNDVSLALAIP